MLKVSNTVSCTAPDRIRLLLISSRMAFVCAVAGVLAACAQTSRNMYDWQAYEPSVYAYLKDTEGDYAAQAEGLEQNVETARASNTALPPGFRAHLGLLYLKLGKEGQAMEQLESEKLAFPESTPFMDFLMKNVPPVSTSPSVSEPTANDASQRDAAAVGYINQNVNS